ncbi:MAG: VanZ family protein [Cetobacterium sp.]|uniref:VanZ family protein n=1 Tax=Cetobacterium sp. TaxID=2071632 RepID=UPI003EE53E62
MKKEKVFKFLSIAVMLSIFWFSHQDGRETMKQSRYIKKQIEKVLGKRLSVNIRKNAHFFIYLGLGSGLLLCREKRGTKEIFQTTLFILLYAIGDEYHQSFIPGREATLRDIGIDLLGGISGIIGVKTVGYIKNIDLYNKNT